MGMVGAWLTKNNANQLYWKLKLKLKLKAELGNTNIREYIYNKVYYSHTIINILVRVQQAYAIILNSLTCNDNYRGTSK